LNSIKKIILTFIVLAFFANVSAQLEVKSSGDTYVSKNIYLESATNFIGTTAINIPITFKLGTTTYAGFTGSSVNTNVSFGYGSLKNPFTGSYNVAVGVGALFNQTCTGNIAIGYRALYTNTTGGYNTANGFQALYNNTSNCNTANGSAALYSNTTGGCNTAIGYGADVSNGNLSNATAIGYNAKVNASNTIVLGNSTVSNIYLNATPILTSDGRTKKNIRAEVPGLAFINQLQPVMYNMNLDALDELQKSDDPKINAFNDSIRNARSPEEKEIDAKARADKEKIVYSGFIAQDVEKAAQSVGYDFSGVDAPKNGKGAYGLGYAEFVVPLVKAVQELSEQNNAKDAAIASLQKQVDELTGLVSRLLGKEGALPQ